MSDYQPVSCQFFDKIEDLAERKQEVRIRYNNNENKLMSTVGHITNIFTKDKIEYLVVDHDDKVRLDRIKDINGIKGPAGG